MCITFFNGSGVASWRKYSRSPTPRWYHWNTPSHRAHRSAVASEEPWWHNSSRVNYHLNHWGCVIFNGMEPRLIQAWGWRRVYRGFPKFLWRIFISSRILFEDPEDIHLICRYLNVGKGIFFFFQKMISRWSTMSLQSLPTVDESVVDVIGWRIGFCYFVLVL